MTSKGQITLPAMWRKGVEGSAVRVRTIGRRVEIVPLCTDEDEKTGWVSVFNADCDNAGKGLTVPEFQKALWGKKGKSASKKK